MFHQITPCVCLIVDAPTKLNIDTQNDAILEAGDTFSKDMIFSINSFNFEGVRFEIIRVESGLKPLFNILKEQKPYTPDPNEFMCFLDEIWTVSL